MLSPNSTNTTMANNNWTLYNVLEWIFLSCELEPIHEIQDNLYIWKITCCHIVTNWLHCRYIATFFTIYVYSMQWLPVSVFAFLENTLLMLNTQLGCWCRYVENAQVLIFAINLLFMCINYFTHTFSYLCLMMSFSIHSYLLPIPTNL